MTTSEGVRDMELPSDVEVSVLMPCLDEARTLPACVAMARRAIEDAGVVGEIVVGDNGSTDGSVALARSLGCEVATSSRRGYGAAVRCALRRARGRYLFMGDADASYDFEELPRYLEPLRAGYDLVMGNRFAGEIQPGAMPPLHRYVGNPLLSGIGRALFDVDVGDFHCGLRAFRKDAIERIGLGCSGSEFASEMVVRARLADLRIAEVPATLRPDGRDRPPHLRTWRDGLRHLALMLALAPAARLRGRQAGGAGAT